MEQRSPRTRLLVVAVLAALWMGAVLARLAYLQLFRYTDYLTRAERQQQRIVEVSAKRGAIYDRNLQELAMSISVESCFAVPAEIANPQLAARLLAGALDTSVEDMEGRLTSSRSFVWIARKVPPGRAARIRALNLRGIYFQKENERFYPKRELAAHVLGFVDTDERGLGGIEYARDDKIRGRPGRMLILADAHRRWYERSEQIPDAGVGVVLTLDEKIQYIAEKELAAAVAETRAQAGTIVVQDPATGELLAVANWPTFNPNAVADSSADARADRAVSAAYEPGSTFKIVTLAAALEEGITRPEEVIDCQMGAIYVAGHRIRDHKPFGLLSIAQIVAQSSDVGAIKLGLRLGAPKFYQYIRAFGFGSPTGVELPGESRGLLRGVENWTPISAGSISMGQEIGVTALQLVSAMSAIANGGLLYRPRIILQFRKDSKILPEEPDPPRRVIRPTTAATLRHLLEGVILEGTGKLARLEGYTAAGKTGTAQKIDPATGRYSPSQYIAGFVGFAPLNNPAVTILVWLDSPLGRHHGGDVAAPVFKRVAEQVLARLEVPHDMMVPPRTLLAVHRPRAKYSTRDLSDFDPAQVGLASDANDKSRFHAGVAASAQAAAQIVALANAAGIAVPRFAGKTVRSVTEDCFRLGLSPVLIGSGIAIGQSPEAGARVQPGSHIAVRFARSAPWVAASGQGN